jgi:succinoglycan biosynthesis protein ExoM
MLVSICIITYQRPDGLARLLQAIENLTFDRLPAPEIEVIVIDNDAILGSGYRYCDRIQLDYKWKLKFGIESQRGISYARNTSIAAAAPTTDFAITIDDDEVPEPQWLEELLLTQQEFDADVVSGPVLPYFNDGDVPEWVKKGKFFDLPQYKNGESVDVAFAGNVMFRAEILRRIGQPFDERFALTGGEDSHLFMRLHQMGYRMVWAESAIVTEWVPKSRATRQYILQRGHRAWSSYSLLEKELYPSFNVQAMRVIKGNGLMFLGMLLLIPSKLIGEHAYVKALRHIYRGSGTIAGLLGIHFEEYK